MCSLYTHVQSQVRFLLCLWPATALIPVCERQRARQQRDAHMSGCRCGHGGACALPRPGFLWASDRARTCSVTESGDSHGAPWKATAIAVAGSSGSRTATWLPVKWEGSADTRSRAEVVSAGSVEKVFLAAATSLSWSTSPEAASTMRPALLAGVRCSDELLPRLRSHEA